MTALDLVQNERKVGGLGRVAEVLLELMEVVDLTDDQVELMKGYSVPTLQRLGHLLGLLEMKDKEEQWLEHIAGGSPRLLPSVGLWCRRLFL